MTTLLNSHITVTGVGGLGGVGGTSGCEVVAFSSSSAVVVGFVVDVVEDEVVLVEAGRSCVSGSDCVVGRAAPSADTVETSDVAHPAKATSRLAKNEAIAQRPTMV